MKTTSTIAGTVLAVIIVCAMALPILSSMSGLASNVAYNNDYVITGTDEFADAEYIFSDGQITLNGEVLDADLSSFSGPIIMADTFRILWYNNTANYLDNTGVATYLGALTISTDKTVSGTKTNGDAVSIPTPTVIARPVQHGNLALLSIGSSNTVMNVDANSEIYAMPFGSITDGSSVVGINNYFMLAHGTINELDAVGSINSTSWATATASCVSNATAGDNGVISLTTDSLTFTLGDYSTSTDYNIYADVKYVASEDSITSTLVGLVPVLLVVGIMIAVVAAIKMRD